LILIPRKSEWLELDGMLILFWYVADEGNEQESTESCRMRGDFVQNQEILNDSSFWISVDFYFCFSPDLPPNRTFWIENLSTCRETVLFHEFISRLKSHLVMPRCASRESRSQCPEIGEPSEKRRMIVKCKCGRENSRFMIWTLEWTLRTGRCDTCFRRSLHDLSDLLDNSEDSDRSRSITIKVRFVGRSKYFVFLPQHFRWRKVDWIVICWNRKFEYWEKLSFGQPSIRQILFLFFSLFPGVCVCESALDSIFWHILLSLVSLIRKKDWKVAW
jgi:hypothetical protein